MNLSSLVHGGRQYQHHFSQRYPSSYAPSREQQIMASSLVANSYTAQPVGQVVNYAYVSAPQAPPSPPIDENSKCSLPSISSLLGLADGGSPEGSPKQQPQQPAPQSSPSPSHQQQQQQQAQQPQQPQQSVPQQQHVMVDYRQNQTSQYDVPTPVGIPRGALPPTPPMHMDSGFDGRQSPSATSSSQYSVSSTPGYYFHQSGTPINNVEPQTQRQHVPVHVQQQQRRATMPTQAPLAYQQTQFGASQYGMPSNQQSMSSYYGSPMQQTPPQQQISGLYYQRPLPQQFPPPIMPGSVSMPPSNSTNPWQHHHYISPSSQASFPQSQDRYICQTCQKAFSRPSSLRIHSHSHTGEKPFKCPHQGCGKAFSVRSNMKRHERGCHTFESHGSMQ